MNNIIDEIKKFVKKESLKKESKYGFEPYEYHLKPMVKIAQNLSRKLGGDKEIITLAAWLHDIGSIKFGRENHHITGAKIAGEKLKELNYPQDKILLVKKCILNHRGSQDNNRDSIEEKIVAEADAMSNFDNISGLFKAAFIYENLNQKEGGISVLKKLERKYKKLHFKESKEIIKPKIEAIRILLK